MKLENYTVYMYREQITPTTFSVVRRHNSVDSHLLR
jgi:hypothetical protein